MSLNRGYLLNLLLTQVLLRLGLQILIKLLMKGLFVLSTKAFDLLQKDFSKNDKHVNVGIVYLQP